MHRHPTLQGQRGVAMIEALIAMLLISLWMLASAGLQGNGFKFQKSAANRYVAVALVGELGESMEANLSGANAGSYQLASTTTPVTSSTDCTSTYCTPAQLAGYDLAQWSARVAAALPMKSMSITSAAGTSGLTTYTIRITWDEPRGRQTYATDGTSETLSYVLTKVVRSAA